MQRGSFILALSIACTPVFADEFGTLNPDEMTWQNMLDRDIDPLAVDLVQPDWVKLAEGFGATGFPATMDTLAETVQKALATKGPSLVHLKI